MDYCGDYLVGDEVCLFLGQASEGVKRAGATVSVEGAIGGMRGELRHGEWLTLTVNSVRERMCVDAEHVSDGDVWMVFFKSVLIRGGFFSILDDYDVVLDMLRAWWIERCVLRKPSIYAGQEFGAQKKLLSSLMLTRRESDGKKEIWVRKVLLLFWCLTKRAIEGKELTVVRYRKCVSLLDEVDEVLRLLCLQ